jgi:hypothetical protein
MGLWQIVRFSGPLLKFSMLLYHRANFLSPNLSFGMSLEGDCHEVEITPNLELLVTFGMSLKVYKNPLKIASSKFGWSFFKGFLDTSKLVTRKLWFRNEVGHWLKICPLGKPDQDKTLFLIICHTKNNAASASNCLLVEHK